MSRLIRYLRGSVRFRLTGAAPEQCLNALAAARLEFWDIEREDALNLSLCVPAREAERLQRLALRCLCTAEVTERSGLRAQFGGLLRRPVLLLGLLPRRLRHSCRSQLSLATCSTAVLGTMLVCANQNYTILQCIAFSLGSGLGYVFAVYIVREGRRRLRSKAVPSIFQGLPSSMIYIGVLSLAIYALVGHTVVL